MKVLNIGSCNIDYIYEVNHMVRPGETQTVQNLQVVSGGKGLNQSIALAKAGVDVYHAGLVGKDGTLLKQTLERYGVKTDYVHEVEGPSGHAIIQIDGNGENSILVYPGANHLFDEQKIDELFTHFEAGDLLLLQNEINEMPLIVNKAYEKGLKIAINPAPFNDQIKQIPLHLVDYLILNEIEGQDLTKETDDFKVLEKLKTMYPKTHLLLTRGSKGVLYAHEDVMIEQSAYKVEAVDTTAAGDTFIGYFVSGLVRGLSMDDILKLASLASSITVTRKGSSTSIPTLEEVLKKQAKEKSEIGK